MQLGLGGVLFVVFLVLKLTHVINWSWWWVTAPLWVGAILFAVFLAIALAIKSKAQRRFDRLTGGSFLPRNSGFPGR